MEHGSGKVCIQSEWLCAINLPNQKTPIIDFMWMYVIARCAAYYMDPMTMVRRLAKSFEPGTFTTPE